MTSFLHKARPLNMGNESNTPRF